MSKVTFRPSWQDDPKKLLNYQLRQMKKWDALRGDRWSVYCVVDKTYSLTYIVMLDGEEKCRRRRPESVASYLLNNGISEKLTYYQDGAAHMMRLFDPSGLLITTPDSDYFPSGEGRSFNVVTKQFEVKSYAKNEMISRFLHMIFHEVVRIIVRKPQG